MASWNARLSFAETMSLLPLQAVSNSWTAITYQSEASTELYSGFAPWSGKRFGNMPSDTLFAQASKMSRASVSLPVAMQSPRNAMNVSRPQSVNHGYPAMMVLPWRPLTM